MKLTIKQKVVSVIMMITIAILLGGNNSFAVSTAKVIVETANLRETATSEAKIVELISKGEEVEIVSTSENWYQVSYKGVTGYLRNDLVEVNENTGDNNGNSTSTNEIANSTDNQTTNTTNTTTEGKETNDNGGQPANQTSENQNNETQENNRTNNSQENTQEKEEPVLTGKYKVTTETKMKITPLITSLTLDTLPKDKEVDVIKVMNQWAWVEYNGSQVWVYYRHLEKVEDQTNQSSEQKEEDKTDDQTEEQKPEENKEQVTKTMYVNSHTVNVRKKADKTAGLLTQLSLNAAVEVISEENGWSQINVNGQKGYISSSLLSATKQQTSRGSDMARQPIQGDEEKKQDTSSSSNANTSQSNGNTNDGSGNASGSAVVAYANQFIGYPYVYGGTSPSGFDCSGFTSYVYRHFGVSLNRTAAGQASNGTRVSKSNLQPGDLLLFGSSINHVGIYMGGGRMVHAANRTRGVTTDTINSGYYLTNYVGARRIFN